MLIVLALAAVAALAACAPAPTRQTLEPTLAPTLAEISATATTAATAEPGDDYPPPSQAVPVPTGYPAGSPAQEQPVNELWMAYPPVPEDTSLTRGEFFIEAAALMPVSGNPGAYDLSVEGSLPTPCNQPRVEVNPPNAQNVIEVEAYSVVDSGMICTQVIQPFTGTVATIAGFPAGTYTVVVNGEIEAGEVTLP